MDVKGLDLGLPYRFSRQGPRIAECLRR